MNKLEALTALRDKVRAGKCDHGSFLQDWHGSPSYSGGCGVNAHKAYDGSLNAAKALHEAVLPGWTWSISDDEARLETGDIGKEWTYKYVDATNNNPARAWLLAILETLIAQEQDT